MRLLQNYFNPAARGSSVRRECLAGLTTFMAMCYLVFVVPAMLADAGMPKDSAVAATIWVSILATLAMGLWAKFPVGVAPGLGITAFFAYYICGPAGYTWQTGLGAVFISGVVFLLLTATRVRQMIINAVPMDLKYAIVVGIGAFIAFIGMKSCGIVAADPSTFVTLGNLGQPQTLLAVAGIFLIGALMALRVPGAMIIGILAVTLGGMLLGVTPVPSGGIFSGALPLPTETFLQMDLKGALHHGLFSIIFTLTMVDLFDNMGVLIGLAQKSGFMREDGHIENLDKALITDSLATMSSALLGATTATSYLESATGVAEGGRTGLTALTAGILFLACMFLAPIAAVIPGAATSAALIYVGVLMLQGLKNVNFDDMDQMLPVSVMLIGMPVSGSIGHAIGLGLISYTVVKVFSGKAKDVSVLTYVISLLFLIKFFVVV